MMNTIHNTDCMEFMKGVKDNFFDLVVTDSPYKLVQGGCTTFRKSKFMKGATQKNIQNGKMFEHCEIEFNDWLPEVYRILKDGSHFYSMVNDRNIKDMLICAEDAGFEFLNMLVWDKCNVVMNKWYMKQTEFICMFRKGVAKTINDAGTSNLISIPNNVGSKSHPSEKPQRLFEVLISNSTKEGEKVFDPFMGAGTTAMAAKALNRQFCGCEIDKKYYEVSQRRLQSVQGNIFAEAV